MKIEKIEVLGFCVPDIEQAVAFFSEVLETDFSEFAYRVDVPVSSAPTDIPDPQPLPAEGTRMAIDSRGYLELIQTPSGDQGFRNIHFKVENIEDAMAEMRQKGIEVVADYTVGGVREVIYNPHQLNGIRLCLIDYDGPSFIEAIMQKKDPA